MPNNKNRNSKKTEKKEPKKKLQLSPTITVAPRRKYKTVPVLSHDERRRVVCWLVDRHSPSEVVKLVRQEFGKRIDRSSVWAYSHSNKKWQPVIKRLQAAIERNLVKIPIANKSYRLLALQTALREALTWRLKGQTPFGQKIFKLDVGTAVRAIEAAERIMEPDKQPVSGGDQYHLHLTLKVKQEKRHKLNSFIQENRGLLKVLLK